MTSTTASSYGNGTSNISGTNYDWGVYNAIYNPKTNTIDKSDIWRILTQDEWNYLLNTRITSSGIRYAKAQVNGIAGLVIIPDNWSTSIYLFDSVNSPTVNYHYNTINVTDWAKMEAAGCVFLPTAGFRIGTTISGTAADGHYWSSTSYGNNSAYCLEFGSSYLVPSGNGSRGYGRSVRLVRYTQAVVPTILTDTVSNITDTSAVCGGHIFSAGGDSIIARGVCWDTMPNPTINGNHIVDSSGVGKFTSNITGLTEGTTYYVRAYATNAVGTAYGNEIMFTTLGPSKSFSVSTNSFVYFSPGNLQWSATNGGSTATIHTVAGNGTAAGTWRFAPNQWDIIGADNYYISATYTGWIDLFGWGTSGSPYNTSSNNSYGNGYANIAGTNFDWGVYNSIYNPITQTTNAPGTWRTLTHSEWVYLLNTRVTPSGIRYAKAAVNGIGGIVIVPDNWSTSIYTLVSPNLSNVAYTINNINATDWANMEAAGCVFLPAAGYRSGTSVSNVNSSGCYWSATAIGIDSACYFGFSSSNLNPSYHSNRYSGRSVRLVRSTDQSIKNLPTITTDTASNITDTSATCGGYVIYDGETAIISRGVCWDTTPNPTINKNYINNGSGTGSFTVNISGLKPGTAYYVRAYATNTTGTAYGNEVLFTLPRAVAR